MADRVPVKIVRRSQGRRLDRRGRLDLHRRLPRGRSEQGRGTGIGRLRRRLAGASPGRPTVDILYNRASADPRASRGPSGRSTSGGIAGQRQWTGYDVPDFPATKPPGYTGVWSKGGMDAHDGDAPFIMKPDGKAWLFAPNGLVDGPLPTHYEPWEAPVGNALYPARPQESRGEDVQRHRQQVHRSGRSGISHRRHDLPADRAPPQRRDEPLAAVARASCSPSCSWRSRPSSAGERGIEECGLGDDRDAPRRHRGQGTGDQADPPVPGDGPDGAPDRHAVALGLPRGSDGRRCQRPPALVGDPNVTIHEAKAFMCQVVAGRRATRLASQLDSAPTRRSRTSAGGSARRRRPTSNTGSSWRQAKSRRARCVASSYLPLRSAHRGLPWLRDSIPIRRSASAARPARSPAISGTSSRPRMAGTPS